MSLHARRNQREQTISRPKHWEATSPTSPLIIPALTLQWETCFSAEILMKQPRASYNFSTSNWLANIFQQRPLQRSGRFHAEWPRHNTCSTSVPGWQAPMYSFTSTTWGEGGFDLVNIFPFPELTWRMHEGTTDFKQSLFTLGGHSILQLRARLCNRRRPRTCRTLSGPSSHYLSSAFIGGPASISRTSRKFPESSL